MTHSINTEVSSVSVQSYPIVIDLGKIDPKIASELILKEGNKVKSNPSKIYEISEGLPSAILELYKLHDSNTDIHRETQEIYLNNTKFVVYKIRILGEKLTYTQITGENGFNLLGIKANGIYNWKRVKK